MENRADNPYAPPTPAGDEPGPAGRPSGGEARGLRIAGGVVLLLVGLWSVAGGGCAVVGGQVAAEAKTFSDALADALPEANEDNRARTRQAFASLAQKGSGLMIAGSLILGAGLLCVIAGVLLLTGRGRWAGYAAATLGVLGELLFFVLVAFNAVGLAKLACYGFGGFCASRAEKGRSRSPTR